MQVQDELARFTADAQYFDQHRQELLRQFPERWVAVHNQQVVRAARDRKQLIRLDDFAQHQSRVYRADRAVACT